MYSKWHCYSYESAWVKDLSAVGRCENHPGKYWSNPQFMLIITEDDIVAEDGYSAVIISLMIKDNEKKRQMRKLKSTKEFIQFRVHKITCKKALLQCFRTGDPLEAKYLKRVGASGPYQNMREISQRFYLSTGEYIITPSTFDEHVQAEFLLRFFSERPLNSSDNDSNDLKSANQFKLMV